MIGRLSIVATPIGNLEDITFRAVRTLREAAVVLAEDTRHTRKLLSHYQIEAKVRSFHAHSPPSAVAQCIADLEEGKDLALVSDAGTPLISDPGQRLVVAARKASIPVTAIPGPSAVATALCVSGVPFDSYRFVGFLPRAGGRRRDALTSAVQCHEATVLFESPHRLLSTLQDLQELLPAERTVAVCRELTKLHEEVVSGTASEVLDVLRERGVRGEITLVVSGLPRDQRSNELDAETQDEAILAALAEGASPRDAARSLSERLGVPKRVLYQRILELRGDADDSELG